MQGDMNTECGKIMIMQTGDRFPVNSSYLFVIRGTANFVFSEAELKGASDISP